MVRLEVTLDVYSGNPNPSWEMPENRVKEFFEIKGWNELMNPEAHGVSLELGYRGFIISIISEQDEGKIDLPTADVPKTKFDVPETRQSNLPSTFRIYGSKALNGQDKNFKPSLSSEEIQEKEKWLLQTYGSRIIDEHLTPELTPKLEPELEQYVEQSISSGGHPTGDTSKTQQEMQLEVQLPSTEVLAACNLWSAYYNPGFWNDSYSISRNNCYNYASNYRSHTFAQPGRAHGCSFSINCSSVHNAARCDGLTNACGSNPLYLVALVIWPGVDYHWYHWHGAGSDYFWGHKPGGTAARNWDHAGRLLRPPLQPHNCNRGPYTIFCGYYYQLRGAVIR
jgi:hypothetical protein